MKGQREPRTPPGAKAVEPPLERGAALLHLKATLEDAVRRAGPEAPRRVLVLTHRGPDPDALGACEGIRLLCRAAFGLDAEVATVGRIHRAENLAMVRALDIELFEYSTLEASRYVGALLVDTQPEFGHTVLPRDIPILAVFDHHVPPDRDDDERSSAIAHKDVRLGIGATSSIVYEYLREARIELDEHTASALFCGVRYDTADLSRNASALDEEAYYETFRRSDRAAIAAIAHPPLPRAYYAELARAVAVARQHGPLVIALLGRIDNPEFVAEMADFLLRMKGVSWVVVGGEYESNYILSLRTDYAFGNAYPLIARVLDGRGSFGGHGHIAGGRIEIDAPGDAALEEIERGLRRNALAVLGSFDDDDEASSEGRSLV